MTDTGAAESWILSDIETRTQVAAYISAVQPGSGPFARRTGDRSLLRRREAGQAPRGPETMYRLSCPLPHVQYQGVIPGSGILWDDGFPSISRMDTTVAPHQPCVVVTSPCSSISPWQARLIGGQIQAESSKEASLASLGCDRPSWTGRPTKPVCARCRSQMEGPNKHFGEWRCSDEPDQVSPVASPPPHFLASLRLLGDGWQEPTPARFSLSFGGWGICGRGGGYHQTEANRGS